MRIAKTPGVLMLALLASCASADGKYNVRPIVSHATPGLTEAESQLALGNAALALEGFRKAWRLDPTEVRAALGIASAYDRMGRHDLSKTWYEKGLALEPGNAVALLKLARSLEQQGQIAEAQSVRAEAKARISGAEAAGSAALDLIADMPLAPAPQEGSVTVSLAAARAVEPPAEPVVETPLATVPAPEARIQEAAVEAPKLERLSLSEVGLFTYGRTAWVKLSDHSSRQSASASLAAKRGPAASSLATTRILNAARREGLAARARLILVGRGWRRIEIGDATSARSRSVVLFPRGRRPLAKSLAAQFGFEQIEETSGNQMVVLLGRDAARLRTLGRA